MERKRKNNCKIIIAVSGGKIVEAGTVFYFTIFVTICHKKSSLVNVTWMGKHCWVELLFFKLTEKV